MSETELYRIVIGVQIWTLTSGPEDVVYNGELYSAVAMGREGIQTKNEMSRANVDVRLPLGHELAVNLLTSFYDEIVSLTIFIQNETGTMVRWKGRLASLKPGDTALTMVFESVFTSLRRPGLRARFQKSCRHPLYGRGCNLDPATYATPATLSNIVGDILTVPAAASQADGYYTGGMVQAADGVLAYIVNHVGNQIYVQRVPYSLSAQFAAEGAGTDINIYPGCDHSRATCIAKFDNLLNYGGFDWIPNKNPMGGSSIV